jgi:Kef-type K+ transport system membrane component KefB
MMKMMMTCLLQASLLALTILFVFFSAWCTEILGVHAIFGYDHQTPSACMAR